MSAPRISQFIPLRQLATVARQGPRQRRHLHMTGPSTFPSPVLSADRPVSNLPRDLTGLQAEARRRNLDASGNKAELTSRLHASDLISHRSFSTRTSRPTTAEPTPSSASATTRHFNTSRSLKANNDSSTIDFAYFPDFASEAATLSDDRLLSHVPIIGAGAAQAMATKVEAAPVMKAQITSADPDTLVSPMSEVSDNASMDIDFQKVASTVGSLIEEAQQGVKTNVEEVKKESGDVARVWKGFLDDVFGEKKAAAV